MKLKELSASVLASVLAATPALTFATDLALNKITNVTDVASTSLSTKARATISPDDPCYDAENDTNSYVKQQNIYLYTSDRFIDSVYASDVIDCNTKLTMPTTPSYGKSGYEFVGWHTKDNGVYTLYDFDTPVTDTLLLYAVFEYVGISYTVRFDSNDGTDINSQTVLQSNYVNEVNAPNKSGYYFLGWYSDPDFTNKWNFESDQVTSDLTLYAMWGEGEATTYTVTFVSNGRTVGTVQGAEKETIETPTEPTRTGYTFQGWYTDEGGKWDFERDKVTTDITLTAAWERIIHYTTTGFLEDYWGNSIGNATITVEQKGTVVDTAVTNIGGVFSFDNLPGGLYNLVVKTDDVTKTMVVNILEEEAGLDVITMPSNNISTLFTSSTTHPVSLVNGLENVAQWASEQGTYDEATVQLTVNKATAANETLIEEAMGLRDTMVSVFDLELSTAVSSYFALEKEIIEDSSSLLELVIDIPTTYRNMDNYYIYRVIDNKVDIISTTANKEGERLVLSADGKQLRLDIKKCSTVALIFDDETYFDSNTKFIADVEVLLDGNEVNSSIFGTVNISTGYPTYNTDVIITTTPSSGFHVGYVEVIDANGDSLDVSLNDDGTYQYTHENEDVTITVNFFTGDGDTSSDGETSLPSTTFFTDVSVLDPFCAAVNEVVGLGLMTGTGGGLFSPYEFVTRGQLVQILYNLSKEEGAYPNSHFYDVNSADYWYSAVAWAQETGVVAGYSDGSFRPNQYVNREELATLFFSFAQKYTNLTTQLWTFPTNYSDNSNINFWASQAVNWCDSLGMMSDRYNNFYLPQSYATRAEVAVALQTLVYAMGYSPTVTN